jgi:hypothetical protein
MKDVFVLKETDPRKPIAKRSKLARGGSWHWDGRPVCKSKRVQSGSGLNSSPKLASAHPAAVPSKLTSATCLVLGDGSSAAEVALTSGPTPTPVDDSGRSCRACKSALVVIRAQRDNLVYETLEVALD